MHATADTATRHATARSSRRHGERATEASRRHRRPSDLPREHRIAYVYRTLGRGLVAEYDPD